MLQPVALPYLQQLQDPIFQQDNARPHTAAVTRNFLRQANVTVLPWPARSPDLSPKEHVWDMIGRRLSRLPHLILDVQHLRHEVRIILREPTTGRYRTSDSQHATKSYRMSKLTWRRNSLLNLKDFLLINLFENVIDCYTYLSQLN